MIMLILLDVICVLVSGYLALLMRFEFQTIEPAFLESSIRYSPVHIVTMVCLYWIFRVYHSLWEYAGYQEVTTQPDG